MKVQLKDIVLSVPALSKLSAENLSLRLAYALKKNISALQKEADFFAEQRQKIFEKYGKANADGTFCFEDEGEQKASAELEELLELEVEPSCQRLDIPLSEELRLSVNDLGALAPFVQFAEE